MLPPGELRCAVECYRRRQTTTADASEQNNTAPYTMCRRASNKWLHDVSDRRWEILKICSRSARFLLSTSVHNLKRSNPFPYEICLKHSIILVYLCSARSSRVTKSTHSIICNDTPASCLLDADSTDEIFINSNLFLLSWAYWTVLILAHLMGQYSFAVWRLSWSVVVCNAANGRSAAAGRVGGRAADTARRDSTVTSR